MCGIFGAIGAQSKSLSERAVSLLAHRGPNGHGTFFDSKSGVSFAHTRLSIIDLSEASSQPLTGADGLITITFNGEIYNFKELREQLINHYDFKSQGDTEVLIAAYLRWGYDMLSKLNGIFAFAIFDRRSDTVFLARDGVGVKPLYYSFSPTHFIFASEIKALLHLPDLNRDLDIQGISHYLSYLYSPGERTPFAHVRKLKPGHAMTIARGKLEKYWQFYEIPIQNNTRKLAVEDAKVELLSHLNTAVSRQMISDVPVGTFLSGGLDSTIISALAQKKQGHRPLDCFTIRFKEWDKEGFSVDLPYADRFAKNIGAKLHVAEVNMDQLVEIDKLVWNLDEPQADPAAMNKYYISQLANSLGVKVLLSGTGADDIFSGYRRHQALAFEAYWTWLPQSLRNNLKSLAGNLSPQNTLFRRIRRLFDHGAGNEAERMVSYFQWISSQEINRLWSKDICLTAGVPNPDLPFVESLKSLPVGITPLAKMLYLETKHFLCDHNLNYADKMSMTSGIETRVPYLDRDLMSFAASLPQNYKLHGLTTKWILRKSVEGFIPAEIINRSKTGFGVPIRSWMRNNQQRLTEDYLSKATIEKRGLFDFKEVNRLIERNSTGGVDASYTILSLCCVESWCRQFKDNIII